MWNPDRYLQDLLARTKPEFAFAAASQEELADWQSRLRERFAAALGGAPGEPAPLDPKPLESVDCGEYVRHRVELGTFDSLRMPCYLLVPKGIDEPRPAVIALHGHGFGSKDAVGLNEDGTPNEGDGGYHRKFAERLALAGYVALVPELLGFGDRKLAEDANNYASCHRISTFLLAVGKTMAGARVFETLRCIDYLQTLPYVAGNRIGCMGISGGGLVATFATAIDDRLRAAVVSGFFNTFEASILGMHHCVDNYVPGLSLIAELPDLFGLIAPRPLLIEAGTKDHIFPIEAVNASYPRLQEMYRVAGADGNLDIDVFDRGHEISGAKAYDWFGRL
ncbi:dienelactone hydrolase family protein [Cohnella sp. GCM10027633]|uniref:dienelactone hydrolase family protein n=1 Tax=unclassified Cohnella TaxID=2636738 RepID=UPI00363BF310